MGGSAPLFFLNGFLTRPPLSLRADGLRRLPGTKLSRPGMSQKSTERLRDYLAQLPPQSQALLMRELERAVERGDDVAVANLVLEQLRKIVRGG
ncbi:hypothetical protein ACVMIH_000163 [Bradyrhizobium sp. USDA 4503]